MVSGNRNGNIFDCWLEMVIMIFIKLSYKLFISDIRFQFLYVIADFIH